MPDFGPGDDIAAPHSCWVVSDGRAGIENQALGLAEAMSRLTPLSITVKRIAVGALWRRAPRQVWGDPFRHLRRESAMLRPPFPDLWVACGRLSIPFTMAVKARAPQTYTIQLQDPRVDVSRFDLVVAPEHDRISGSNVVSIVGSPNRISAPRLIEDANALAPELSGIRRPRTIALIGGPSRGAPVGVREASRLVEALERASRTAGLMITTSRRTPAVVTQALEAFAAETGAYLWDGRPTGGLQNPYFGLLGLADAAIVTGDSVNMATEAATAGLPVNVHYWRGRDARSTPPKFQRLHAALEAAGAARPLSGAVGVWSPPVFNETARAAAEAVSRWRATVARREGPAGGG